MSDEWQVPGFTPIRELGRGGGGTVVEATDDAGTPVAIKYLSGELLADDGFRAAFRTEAELLAGLDTPHITRLFEYVEGTRGAAIVMELVNGTSLRATLLEHGPTEPESALSVLKGSLLGLGAAHRAGVVHRDYKPENVLVTPEGESKLVDFGIAARSGGGGDGAGTPAYMPPEQWAGGSASTQGDIYAATATFVEALTGRPPFVADDFCTLRDLHEHAPVPVDDLPEPLHGLALRGLAKNPIERPVDAQDFLVQLEQAAITGYGPDWEERGRDSLARRAALLALLSADAVGAAGSTAVASSALGRFGQAARRPAAVAAVGLVLAAGLAAVAVTSVPRDSIPSFGQTTVPQRVVGQPVDIPSGSAPVATPNAPVPAGPPNSGEPGVSPPARGEPAGEAGGGGAPQVVVLPPPPARVYHPRPPDIHIDRDRHDGGDRRPHDDGGGWRRPHPGGGIDTPGEPGPGPAHPIDPPIVDKPPYPVDPPPIDKPPNPDSPYPPIDKPPHPIDPPPIDKPRHPIDPPIVDKPPVDPKPSYPDGGTDTPSDGGAKPPILRSGKDREKTDTGTAGLPHRPGGTDNDRSGGERTKRPHHPTGDGERDRGRDSRLRHPRDTDGKATRGSHSDDSSSQRESDSSSQRESGSSSKADGGSHGSKNNGSDDSGPVVK